MAFENLPPSKPAPRRTKEAPILSVGWRAYVNWSRPHQAVPLVDNSGKPLPNDLADGQQMEVLSWRPQAREGVMYEVRRMSDASVWWVEARYLRRTAIAETATPVTAAIFQGE